MQITRFKVLETKPSLDKEMIDYGVRMIGAPLIWHETNGKGITVAVVDTGIDETHPDLQGRVVGGQDFTGGGSTHDKFGHGTHVAGIIAAALNGKGVVGVAPEVSLLAVKVLGDNGYGDDDWVAAGIRWAADNGADVISMSLGTPVDRASVRDAVKYAHDKGCVLVAAAGNDGDGNPNTVETNYPAAYPEVISVAAVDARKDVANFSDSNPTVEVAAAGYDVWSTYLDHGYARLSGTSMATPHISGAIALLQALSLKKRGNKLAPAEVRVLLEMYCEDLGTVGKDNAYGYGVFTFAESFARVDPEVTLRLTIGSKMAERNGNPVTLDAAPVIVDNRTMVPLRFVSEQLGAAVEWDEGTRTVTVRR